MIFSLDIQFQKVGGQLSLISRCQQILALPTLSIPSTIKIHMRKTKQYEKCSKIPMYSGLLLCFPNGKSFAYMKNKEGWLYSSVNKRMFRFYRGHRFNSQYTHSILHSSLTPVPRDPASFPGFQGQEACIKCTYKQARNHSIRKIKINL